MNIISQEFKNIYKNMIDEILSAHALTNQCTLYYKNNNNLDYCDNCYYDPITNSSANLYNNTGPSAFIDGSICPECMGLGKKQNSNSTKVLSLAVIIDSKYFLNFDKNLVNIPNNIIQTICSIDYSMDILNASALSIGNMSNVLYERISDINPVGLGDLNYIFTNWKKQ
jgi:hypothetical protein